MPADTELANNQLPFLLSTDDKKLAIDRATRFRNDSILPGKLRESAISHWIEHPSWLKTHDWHLLTGLTGAYFLSGFLGPPQARYINLLLSACNRLLSKKLDSTTLPAAQKDLKRALAELESWLPSAELGMLRHQMLHICDAIPKSGPLWAFSMWPFERLWGRLGKWIKQTVHPEMALMNAYNAFQAASSR